MTELILSAGKYHFIANDDGTELRCLRYGEHWREFVGDNAIHCLYDLALDQQKRIADLEQKLNDLQTAAELGRQVLHKEHCPDAGNMHCLACLGILTAIERSRQ